jgi:hypothetical protein
MNLRPFSRHLPPLPLPNQPTPLIERLGLAGFAAGFIALTYYHPIPVIGFLVFTFAGGAIFHRIDTRRKLALAASRPGDPLCAFARAVDLRTVDSWVVRATFEALQPYFPEPLRPFPVLPTDRIKDFLHIEDEEVEDIAKEIATRAGYSLEHTEQNPLHGEVVTVGDLIQFFTHQPRTPR